jgi:hypothetical protein
MRRQAVISAVASLAAAVVITGCGQDETSAGADDDPGTATAMPTTQATAMGESPGTHEPSQPPPKPPADEPATSATEHRVTYDWSAPSEQVTIEHPAAAPLPYLVAIYVGDHPEGNRPYQRIAFYFRDGFPEYNLQYVPSVAGEGTGEPITLEGNAFLRIGFVNAQAHDNAGESTVAVAPGESVGFQNLKSYASAGDFEGHLTFGLGLQVAPNSDQVLAVRAGELTKPDDTGGTYHVVYVDVETG